MRPVSQSCPRYTPPTTRQTAKRRTTAQSAPSCLGPDHNPIDTFNQLQDKIRTIGTREDAQVKRLGFAHGCPIHAIHLPCLGTSEKTTKNILITGGVHGNEHCGPAAAIAFAEKALGNSHWREHLSFTIIPFVNPRGYIEYTRETLDNCDPNRQFSSENPPPEVELVRTFLGGMKHHFHTGIDLHSGGTKENAFWLLHHNSADFFRHPVKCFREDDWPMVTKRRGYKFSEPGIGTSRNNGTLKTYMAEDLAIPNVATFEAPRQTPLEYQSNGEVTLLCKTMEHILASAKDKPRRYKKVHTSRKKPRS